jgi:hypothetical protein
MMAATEKNPTCDPDLPPSPPVFFFGLNGKKRVVLVVVSLVLYEGIYIHGVPRSSFFRPMHSVKDLHAAHVTTLTEDKPFQVRRGRRRSLKDPVLTGILF